MPEPQVSAARSAMLRQEESVVTCVAPDEWEVFSFTHGRPYFQATKMTATTTIHLTSFPASMRAFYAGRDGTNGRWLFRGRSPLWTAVATATAFISVKGTP